MGSDVLVVPTDVNHSDAVKSLAQAARQFGGAIDLWFSNVGVGAVGKFLDVPMATHEQIIRSNLIGHLNDAHAALDFAGFADRRVALLLTDALLLHESTFSGFGAIREYAAGHRGSGDVDSGPVLLGVSVAATGFALGPARAHGRNASFERIFRTATLFGIPYSHGDRRRFATGGAIGNALLLALLTSGPELAPL